MERVCAPCWALPVRAGLVWEAPARGPSAPPGTQWAVSACLLNEEVPLLGKPIPVTNNDSLKRWVGRPTSSSVRPRSVTLHELPHRSERQFPHPRRGILGPASQACPGDRMDWSQQCPGHRCWCSVSASVQLPRAVSPAGSHRNTSYLVQVAVPLPEEGATAGCWAERRTSCAPALRVGSGRGGKTLATCRGCIPAVER